MTKADWITMIIPIIADGLLLYLFQKVIEKKFERREKHNDLRDETIILFWKKMQEVNDALISANIEAMKDVNSVEENIFKISNIVFKIVQFYDTNRYDLKIFEKEYSRWNESWNVFATELNKNCGKTMSNQTQILLGKKLQSFKESTNELIEVVRKK